MGRRLAPDVSRRRSPFAGIPLDAERAARRETRRTPGRTCAAAKLRDGTLTAMQLAEMESFREMVRAVATGPSSSRTTRQPPGPVRVWWPGGA